MGFLKKLFDDESQIVGLCGFDSIKPKHYGKSTVEESFFNHFSHKRNFQTDFSENILLNI